MRVRSPRAGLPGPDRVVAMTSKIACLTSEIGATRSSSHKLRWLTVRATTLSGSSARKGPVSLRQQTIWACPTYGSIDVCVAAQQPRDSR